MNIMKTNLILILSFICISLSTKQSFIGLNEDQLCEGNRFIFLSTYLLGRQESLQLTFNQINKTAKIKDVIYKDELFRTYRIFDVKPNIVYMEGKQSAELQGNNILRITGGTVRVNLTFAWEKTQLGSKLIGTGTGLVVSDVITYEQTLHTNLSHDLQWYLSKSSPVVINTGISLTSMQPYRDDGYEILTNMLSKLKDHQPTVKDYLIETINVRYQQILRQKVLTAKVNYNLQKTIQYYYTDYHGAFNLTYNNTLMNSTLAKNGLYLLFSQVIQNDDNFQCGDPVPFEPDDQTFGGLQQFMSNSLLKSTVRYAIKNGSLDVVLNEQWWQSRAFQFFMGDVHEVMPTSTKTLPTLLQINGTCKALDDPVFNFIRKSNTAYQVKVNFACHLTFNKTMKLIDINMVANYEISPKVSTKKIDFVLTGISGTPVYLEASPFKIQYKDLADFMVSETLNIAKGGEVMGSGYKITPRKFPGYWVKQKYLFLYDSSAKPKLVTMQ